MSKGWYSLFMFPILLQEFLAYIDILSNTVMWYNYPCNSWTFFLPTAPSILLPRLGSKEGWEQALSHVALCLAPLGSWLRIPNTRLSDRPPAGHRPSSCESAYYSDGKYSIGTNGVLILLEHAFPIAYQGITNIALPPALLWGGGGSHSPQLTTTLVV